MNFTKLSTRICSINFTADDALSVLLTSTTSAEQSSSVIQNEVPKSIENDSLEFNSSIKLNKLIFSEEERKSDWISKREKH